MVSFKKIAYLLFVSGTISQGGIENLILHIGNVLVDDLQVGLVRIFTTNKTAYACIARCDEEIKKVSDLYIVKYTLLAGYCLPTNRHSAQIAFNQTESKWIETNERQEVFDLSV
jgi:hypothetical protein